MPKNKFRQFIILMLTAMSLTTSFKASAVETVGDLDAVQSETIMGKAQLDRAKVLDELRKLSGEGPVVNGIAAMPQARWIMQVNGVAEATLAYGNGKIDVREGDSISGGYKVLHINPTQGLVQLKDKNGRVFDIPISNEAGLSSTPAAQPWGGSAGNSPGQYPNVMRPVPALNNSSVLTPSAAPIKASQVPLR